MSFLAASASRAAIHNMLSLKGNLADMTAKSGAQTILACMVGAKRMLKNRGGLVVAMVYSFEVSPNPACSIALQLACGVQGVERGAGVVSTALK